jgi:threonine dehydrogenase-like Zn-dependent dehydrogenase
MVAKVRGARRVFVSEVSPIAREVLGHYDFTVIDPSREPIAKAIGGGVRAVFDSVGSAGTFEEGLALLEESGTYVNLAVHGTPLAIDGMRIASERTVTTSSNAFYRDVAEAYDMIFTRRVDVRPMITHCFPLSEYQRAYDLLLSVPKQAYKAVLKP